jgi:NAD(P)-dependent dehydrogenase (short-subunit alcohol dehydrogenase family)
VTGRAVVITGAGSGIGAALARRLAAAGDRLVLNDLDPAAVTAVAAEVGAVAVPGNAASEDGVQELIERARDEFGTIDVFFANAGIGVHGGPEASEDGWQRSWDVNVMAHVRAARLLVPRWVERAAEGQPGGCFVSTASAAGLLVQLGSATYTTSKHAALGFAEWLAATYGDRGVQVCCLCPMGVRTQMVEGGDTSDNPDARLGHAVVSSAGEMMAPLDVADVLLDAVTEGRFLALPHPEVDAMQQNKAADRDGWLAAMQHVRRTVE